MSFYIVPGTTRATNTATTVLATPSSFWEVRRDGALIAHGAMGIEQGGWLVRGLDPVPTASDHCLMEVTAPATALQVSGYQARAYYEAELYTLDFRLTPDLNALELSAEVGAGGQTTLSWTAVADFVRYRVFQYATLPDAVSRVNGTLLAEIDVGDSPPTNEHSFEVCTLTSSLMHYRVVHMDNIAGPLGQWSNIVSAAPRNDAPLIAADTSFTVVNAPTREYQLDWTDANRPSDFQAYVFVASRTNLGPYYRKETNIGDVLTHSFTADWGDWIYSIAILDTCGVLTPEASLFLNLGMVSSHPRTTDPPIPDQPIAVTGDSQITISWPLPADTDSAIVGFKIYVDGASLELAQTTTLSYTHTGLTNGVAHTYRVSAVDLWGNESDKSVASDPATPSDAIPPAIPMFLNARAAVASGTPQAVLRWRKPASAVATDTAKFKVYEVTGAPGSEIYSPVPGGETADGNTYSLTVTPLVAGTTYRFVVTALDEAPAENESEYSNEAVVTARAVSPDPALATLSLDNANPLNVAFNGTASIAFTAPDARLIRYAAFLFNSPYYVPLDTAAIELGGGLLVSVGGLLNGVAQTVFVAGYDEDGFATAFTSKSVTPVDTVSPEPPTSLQVLSAGNGSVSLGWVHSPSLDLGGYRLQRYTRASDGTYVASGLPVTVSSSSTTTTVTGLTNGVPAHFALAAYDTRPTAPNLSVFTPVVSGTPKDAVSPPVPPAPTVEAGIGRIFVTPSPLDTPPVDLVTYRIFREGFVLVGESDAGVAFEDGSALVGVTYNYHCAAVDASGNQSLLSVASAPVVALAPTSAPAWSNTIEANCERVRLLLRGEFINDDAKHFTGRVNVIGRPDSNFVDLRFGFDLVDLETLEPRTVKNIESLVLSNSPIFDSGASVEITVIPYDNAQVSVVSLNRGYFEDPANNVDLESSRSLEYPTGDSPAGTFVIRDWPLSGDGGGETFVYYRALVSCEESEEIALYPNGYLPVASVLWESTAPVAPGVPAADNPDLWYTGRRTLWRFDGATESASARKSRGVQSYQVTTLEVRGERLLSTQGDTVNGLRSIASTVPANAMSVWGYLVDPSLGSYTVDEAVGMGEYETITNSQGVAWITNSTLEIGNPSPTADADFALEARFSLPVMPEGAAVRLFLRACLRTEGVSDLLELEVRVAAGSDQEAFLRRMSDGVMLLGREQRLVLPDWFYAAAVTGGSLELHLSTNGPNEVMYAEAYFTPQGGGESLVLGSATVPGFEGTGPWNLSGEFAAFAPSGAGVAVQCDELILGSGIFHVGVDIGDADTDFGTPLGYPCATTLPLSAGGLGWSADLGANAIWSSLSDTTSIDSNDEVPSVLATAEQVTLSAPLTEAGRSAFELDAALPSYSVHTLLRWSMKSVTGEFYVALSPAPATHDYEDGVSTLPLCRRCDGDTGMPTLPYDAPTVLVAFSETQKRVYAISRSRDGVLRESTLASFISPSSFEEWSLEVNAHDGHSVMILRRGAVNVGQEFSFPFLASAPQGGGLYAAFGVRSDGIGATRLGASRAAGNAVVSDFSIYGLPSTEPMDGGESPRRRHYMRGVLGKANAPSLLGQNLLAANADKHGWPYAADGAKRLFFTPIRFAHDALGPILGSTQIGLTEVRLRRRGLLAPDVPRIRFYGAIIEGQITEPLSPWIASRRLRSGDYMASGGAAPYNELVQFDLSDFDVSASEGRTLFLCVELPAGCELAGITDLDVCQDETPLVLTPDESYFGESPSRAFRAEGLWYRLFERHENRLDNPRHNTFVQCRVRALSHARVMSAVSLFSRVLRVDLAGPQDVGYIGKPVLSLPNRAARRAATVRIRAVDDGSGLKAFRVLHETDAGVVKTTPWLSWSAFIGNGPDDTVDYTVYLYGDDVPLAPNASYDGPRRVWAQVMDAVGNVSETKTLHVFAQATALVDTLPPTGVVAWADPYTGEVPETTNANEGHVRLSGYDAVSGIKDARIRPLGAEEWKDWALLSSYQKVAFSELFDTETTDGLARVEVQFRDWGGTAQQPSGLWDVLSRGVSEGLLFTTAVVWRSPSDASKCLYLGAIRTQTFSVLSLSQDDTTIEGGYLAVSEEAGRNYGKVLRLRDTDNTTLLVNDVEWTRWDGVSNPPAIPHYHIVGQYGVILLDSELPDSPDFSLTVRRENAQLYRWDGTALARVADLGGRGERAPLSLFGLADSLLIGGGSGKLWVSDGTNIYGPVFTATLENAGSALPITVLHAHQFDAEGGEPYLYLATAVAPRIFRAPLSLAATSEGWERVTGANFVSGESGDFLCAVSAYDRLLLGTAQGKVISYRRGLIYSDVANLEEIWDEQPFTAPPVDGDPVLPRPVQTLLPSGGEVYAGIGDRPEIWRYTESYRPLPRRPEDWVSLQFTRMFASHSAPWQFYTSTPTFLDNDAPNIGQRYDNRLGAFTGHTVPATSGLLGSISITDPRSATGFREIVALRGDVNKLSVFAGGQGTDWPVVISGQTQWTLELEMMRVDGSGSGRQGFTISDGRYYLEVSLSAGDVRVQSGGREASAEFWTDGFSAMRDTGMGITPRRVYPSYAPAVLWSFPGIGDSSPVQGGPYYDGSSNEVTSGDPQGWRSAGGVITPEGSNDAGIVSSRLYAAGQRTSEETYVTHLAVQPMPMGTPRIINGASGEPVKLFSDGGVTILTQVQNTSLPVRVDRGSKLYVRCRVRPKIGSDLRDARIRATWSYTDSVFLDECHWVEAPLAQEWNVSSDDSFMDADPYTYILEPSWEGEVRTLAIEWIGIPESDIRAVIEVEFIAIASEFSAPAISSGLTPVRLGVEGRRIKVWIGAHVEPLIDEEDFLTLPVSENEYELRIGKIDPAEPGSVWAYGSLRFRAGEVMPPIELLGSGWQRAARLPSAGGVRKMLHYLGTAVAVADGIGHVRRADNPEERALKLFHYDPGQEIWVKKEPAAPIDQNGVGCVRALVATAFGDELILAGQQALVRYASEE